MKIDRNIFYSDVYHIVSQIPYGRVCTYGMLARIAGWPGYARMVGHALAEAPLHTGLPCYRVVNSQGRMVPHWPEQRDLLEQEGVGFKPNGCVDLKKHLWDLF